MNEKKLILKYKLESACLSDTSLLQILFELVELWFCGGILEYFYTI